MGQTGSPDHWVGGGWGWGPDLKVESGAHRRLGGLLLYRVKYLKLVFLFVGLSRREFQMGKGLLYQRVFGKLSVTGQS